MCGFAGIYRHGGRRDPDDERTLRGMIGTLAHRGPDDEGVHLTPEAALGFRRLSIVDLEAGHQPLPNEDETIWLLLNGEIYNHAELRPELEGRGHRWRTRSDAEAVIHAYEEWGPDCLKRLQGMFSLALFDARKNRLFAARDRLGIKPFHYTELPGESWCSAPRSSRSSPIPGSPARPRRRPLRCS